MSSGTQTEHALITLRQRIVSGTLLGGERLYEVALANELQISRTPIRAALSKLAEEGLLDRVKAGGFAVRRFDLGDVTDTIEFRGVLEGTAARLAAERGAPTAAITSAKTAVAQIDAILANENINMYLYSQWNTEFHNLLADLSGSRVLGRELARVTALPFASPSAFLDDENKATQFRQTLIAANEQHRGIVEAIEARQGYRAEALAREHARAALRNVEFLSNAAAGQSDGSTPLAILST